MLIVLKLRIRSCLMGSAINMEHSKLEMDQTEFQINLNLC
jgi:hypothetical protein